MVKFGISVNEDLLEDIEDPLEYGDGRSERVRELIELGLAVEDAADAIQIDLPEDPREQRALIRQAFLDADL